MSNEEQVYAIQARALSKSFGDHVVLHDIDLDVARGETLAIIGPSGSGKSTLCRTLVGLEEFDSGEILLDGDWLSRRQDRWKPLEKAPGLRRRRLAMGMVFQNYSLFPQLTVLQNLTLAPRRVLGVSGAEAEARGLQLLERVGLGEKAKAYPQHLSGGQQQRAAIARELAMNREILFFDEATSALDPELVSEVLQVIEELTSSGLTMIIVSHEMGFVRRAADRVVLMDEGRIVETADPAEFFENPREERSRTFLAKMMA